jgi:hypothetical protein
MNWMRRLCCRLFGRHPQPEFPHLFWLLNTAWLCQAVYVVAKLDIAEHLRGGPLKAGDLAHRCGVQPGPLIQVMRALAGFGVFVRDSEGRFALNSKARQLLRDAEFSVHAYATIWGDQLYDSARQMLTQVRTGNPGFAVEYGAPIWEFYRQHPDKAEEFDVFMNSATDLHTRFIAGSPIFASSQLLVDLGAGRGSLLTAILRKHPRLQGVWYDREELLSAAKDRIVREGVGDRCQLIAGDFRDRVPPGADLYVIKHVLHDWADEPAAQVIGNVARAMDAAATLLIIEAVMNDDNGVDGLCKLRDLEQMFWTGSRVRTQVEFERLLAPSGLEISSITSTPIVDMCLITVRKLA